MAGRMRPSRDHITPNTAHPAQGDPHSATAPLSWMQRLKRVFNELLNGEIGVDCGSAGLEACLDEAARRTKQLAAGGDVAAQYQLGREHRYVPGEPEVLWLKRAAKGGHASNNVTIRVDAQVRRGAPPGRMEHARPPGPK